MAIALVCLGCGEALEPTELRQIDRATGTQASICPTCGCDEFRLDAPTDAGTDRDCLPPGAATLRHSGTDD
jgi:hypothetical protein